MSHGDSFSAILSCLSSSYGLRLDAALSERIVLKTPYGVDALNRVLLYLTQVAEIDPDELGPYVHDTFGETVFEDLMTTAEKILQRGKAEGRLEGKAEGKAEVLLKLALLKFGPLSSASSKRIEMATLQELDRYTANILTARTVDELFG